MSIPIIKLLKKSAAIFISGLLGAALALTALLYCVGRALRPEVSHPPPVRSSAEVDAAENKEKLRLDPKSPPVIYRAVTYTDGAKAAWWPKAEAPVLAGLVHEGKLPPVAVRTGAEPVVLEGVDGLGRYGGSWYRLATDVYDVSMVTWRLSDSALVRWSPQGYPLVPQTVKSWEISPDFKSYVFTLRRGMKWSDGFPVTADDLLYWYQDEVLEFKATPQLLRVGSALGKLEKIDDEHVRFVFPQPNPLFLERIASMGTLYEDFADYWTPAHYLRQYHPRLGNQDLIRRSMAAWKLASPFDVYKRVKYFLNPECPRLWPWVYRTYVSNPPFTFVRNPYYCAVDPAGRQLPYLDRLVVDVKTSDLIAVAAANGEVSMQDRHLRYEDHVLLAGSAAANGYEVYDWFPATRSLFTIFPNLNRRIEPGRPETARKAKLLADVRFRQALSLAINRRAIIDAEFNGRTEPAQIDPGRESPYHDERLFHAFTDYDPGRANRLLDSIGLNGRDREGFRTFSDGVRMTFFLHLTDNIMPGPAQFVVDDWARVGVRAIVREEARPLWDAEKRAYTQDFTVWTGESEFFPLVDPRNFVATQGESYYAPAYGVWYQDGGLAGDPQARRPNALEPPPGHPMRRAMAILDQVVTTPDPALRQRLFHGILEIAADNLWTISICTPPPQLVVVKNGFRNVPKLAVFGAGFITPGNTGIETYYWENPPHSPGIDAQTRSALLAVTPEPRTAPAEAKPGGGGAIGALLRWLFGACAAAVVLALSVRHPFIGRRLLLMALAMTIVTAVVFTIVQLPPGDFVQAYIARLEMEGTAVSEQQVADLRHNFHLDEPMVKRYLRWTGLFWFTSFQAADTGLLQGNLGLSMEYQKPVNEVVGDRIVLTVVVSFLTIACSWLCAIPIGIYSAVRQYSAADYAFTLLGFLGVSVPEFLLAVVVIYWANQWAGLRISGLFSPEFATMTGWNAAKFGDLMKHIWVPVLVLGFAGTAAIIRVMRANLLDELGRQYVVTARAKGLPPWKVLFKYPVRLALNPVISSLGSLFPQLVSGSTIVAMVLSLPMVGPMMFDAMLVEDIYLAGSMLVVLSLLGMLGTLVSDLLLLWLDPRIRFSTGTR